MRAWRSSRIGWLAVGVGLAVAVACGDETSAEGPTAEDADAASSDANGGGTDAAKTDASADANHTIDAATADVSDSAVAPDASSDAADTDASDAVADAATVDASDAAIMPDAADASDASDAVDAHDAALPIDAGPCTPLDWATEPATTDQHTHLEGATAVDPAGGVHTSATEFGTDGGIRYVHRETDGGWFTEEAPYTGFPNYNALARGADGSIHLAYRDARSISIAMRYAVRDPLGVWTTGTIHNGENPAYPSLVAAPTGRIHVAFQPGDGSKVAYAYRDPPAAWTAAEKFDTGVLADNVTLDVDATGGLHVAYVDAFTHNIKYAYRPAVGSWTIGVVDAAGTGGTGGPRSLVVDAAGNVHLAYATSAGLVYARRSGGTWTKEPADATAGRGCEAALALDAVGTPVIAYKHCTGSGIWFTRRAAANNWPVKSLDATGVYLGPATIATDATFGVHVVWKNGNANLTYAHARVCP